MQSKLEKVVAGLKTGPRFLKELREFDNLVKAIGECKSKAEEDRIITQELELLKTRLSDPKLDKSRGKEYMIRLIYCEMLGHDASFAYVKALQFASDPNIHTKKAAYLALTQFLDCNNNLVLLLVNTLLSDLKSDNYIIVCSALVAATRLIGADLVNAVYPVVVERLRHPKEHVRKKAVLALHWFGSLDPRREGPLAGVELEKHFRTMLCDKDPSVMSAALCALHDCIKADTRPFKNLIPSFTSILKQVSEHRLPKTYDYHRFPAPFIQIKLLKILAALGAGDRTASENMAAVLAQTLRRANTSHTIGSAIIYEAVRTITTIYPNPPLLAAAAESIATFLRSPSHNLRYVGIDALAGITALNPAAAAEHQVAVLDCLEDPDDTLKLKTLELLYKMTRSNNIQVIVDKMMGYLGTCSDDHIRRDVVRKVCDLAERYAPSPAWFVTTLSEVFRLAGEHVDEGAAHGLCRLIAQQDEGLHAQAVEAYLGLLDGAVTTGPGGAVERAGKKLPETILLVICWVLGEYGHLARRPPAAVLSRLLAVLSAHKATGERVRCALLAAATRLAAHTGGGGGAVGALLAAPHHAGGGGSGPGGVESAAEVVHAALSSQSTELQQRAHELQALMALPPGLLSSVLPSGPSCQELTAAETSQLASLAFLDDAVEAALAAGAAPYVPPEARGGKAQDERAKGLRFEAYEPAPYALPLAGSSASHTGGAGDSRSSAVAHSGASSSAAASGAAAASASGPSFSAPSEPQLVLKGAAGRRWGPAQYEAEAQAPAPSAASYSSGPSTSAAAGAGSAAPRSGHHSRNASGSAPLSGRAAEREQLAASLFGGGGLTGQAPAPAAPASRPSAARTAAAPAPAAASRPAPAPTTPLDLLMDLGAPSPPGPGPTGPAPGPAGPGGDWMDSLMGPALHQPPQAQAPHMGMGGGGMGMMGGPGMGGMGPGGGMMGGGGVPNGGGMGGPMGGGTYGGGGPHQMVPGPGVGQGYGGPPQPGWLGAPGGMGQAGGMHSHPPQQQQQRPAAGADPFVDLLG
ncbi:hypothetical protein HYH03_014888 [Edaphochlamys debaryana]|uniref:Clathrin/coatomer adaptor adaptin-like N-terminal domain-containing protein n=1 Tax=Edaphochlamys debaryana TaxID=47281 RepID=A0A835XQJ5_9CHLO|nr:hypothetical protein HYH03_014888 [Edaphochlamys debaryana]|eukprot:KAG2486441.1 hypothetical protein HYH03_014888 [Edaphochlamys debaryana]